MALKASWWRWTQNPRLLFLLSGIKSGSTFMSIFSLRIRLNKSNEGIANFWILLKTSLEVQYSGGLYGRETRAAKKRVCYIASSSLKNNFGPKTLLDVVYSGFVPGENSSGWFHGEPGTHLHCSTGECNITSDWNSTKLWLKVMLRNPLVLALALTWMEEFVQRLLCCFMP